MRILIAVAFAAVACGVALPRVAAAPPAPGDAAFERLAEEYLHGHLAWRPALGVSLGLHDYDGRITDFSPASLAAELTRLKSFDARLASFPTNGLGREAFGDYLILGAAVRKELFEFEDLRSYAVNPMTYAGALDVNLYLKRDYAPLDQRVRAVVAVLREAPRVFAAARTNLASTLPRPYVETAIDMATGGIDFLNRDLPVALRPLTNETRRSEAAVAAQRTAAELQGFVAWLKDEQLPRAHDHYALGSEKFARMLRDEEMVDLPPNSVLALGLRELAGEQERFAAAARQIDPTKPPVEVFKTIQRDHPTELGLIPDTRKNLEAIRQFVVDHQITTIPAETRPIVAPTPAYLRATSFASMDTPGPFETQATEAYYYVTPVEPVWASAQKEEWLTAFNYYTTDVVSIHEAWPGHYLQALCLTASPASRLRKIFGSYAFIEGWAHYAEQMMLDEGFGADGKDPIRAAKYRLAQSDEALLRLCRLCAAIRIHCEGMTVDEATRFFQENCYYEEKPAHQEALRGTFDPGYLNYTLGKLMLLKLRGDYRSQQGAKFSLKAFHDEVLRYGQPPVPLLRQMLLRASAPRDIL
jgi:uncharacterized protein (DUF885 family)